MADRDHVERDDVAGDAQPLADELHRPLLWLALGPRRAQAHGIGRPQDILAGQRAVDHRQLCLLMERLTGQGADHNGCPGLAQHRGVWHSLGQRVQLLRGR